MRKPGRGQKEEENWKTRRRKTQKEGKMEINARIETIHFLWLRKRSPVSEAKVKESKG